MASSGDGSFNPPKKKGGFLTPKLLRKRDSSSTKDKKNRKEERQNVNSPSTSAVKQGVTGNDCVNHAVDCQVDSMRAIGRLSSSSEDLASGTNKNNVKRKSKTLTLKRKKVSDCSKPGGKQSTRFWAFHLKKRLPNGLKKKEHEAVDPAPFVESRSCVCTSYKRTEDIQPHGLVFPGSGANILGASASPIQPSSTRTARLALGAGPGPTGARRYNPQLFQLVPAPPQAAAVLDMARSSLDDYPTEDIDELMIAQRARDMELGIEISPSHLAYPHLHYSSSISSSSSSSGSSGVCEQVSNNLSVTFQNQCVVTTTTLYPGSSRDGFAQDSFHGHEGEAEYGEFGTLSPPTPNSIGSYIPRTVHTQVDYIHCLVPDLKEITKCSFYWGVIDRYEAERLLENRPEGTFLLRDSAQEEFLFSVSFRRYGRSLHARIEQWNHKFSFDSHDPGVFASDTVCGLIEHYKDPSCCMFFEPMLTIPLNRTFPFSLQHLCRTVICNTTIYDALNFLPLPKSLRDYLKYYHYKQKVRVRQFEMNN
ncbi:hypothetical protein LSH36_405g01013 [Paralvinella palmiformis]|uniref:Suppressor of cytokine signaling 5 n=1 Tax=Paralvinella palmiformis TaxID=53620 RepID=A0AAD9MYR7_9ANNE|nr:hypothetical protein LSH36_405g01013 [Paralvinella palmiformis]